jgi:hypothetical protein
VRAEAGEATRVREVTMGEHTVGQTKIVGNCSVGAIVQLADITLVICDIRQWKDDESGRPYGTPLRGIRRLQSVIGHDKILRKPPIRERNERNEYTGARIPAVRFPRWMRCPGCHILYQTPWENADDPERPVCRSPKCIAPPQRLVPVPYVMISPQGYLDDLPWRMLAHLEATTWDQRKCQVTERLALGQDEKTRFWTLRCGACGATTSLRGLKNKEFLSHIKHMRTQPWEDRWIDLTKPDQSEGTPITGAPPIAVPLSDTRIHIAKTLSALEIPPESQTSPDDLRARLQDHVLFDELWAKRDDERALRFWLRRLSRSDFAGHDVEEMLEAFTDVVEGWPYRSGELSTQANEHDLYAAEYRAFHRQDLNPNERERFVIRQRTEAWRALFTANGELPPLARGLGRAISSLVVADRLRVIQAFQGFSRVSDSNKVVPPDITGQESWLPGVELFGEGIFFTLDERLLQAWERTPSVRHRAEELDERMATPRFLLLHTLSHLIIRELESSCGYPAASINERLYCDAPDAETPEPMAGALIYLAVPDKLGSLGGLAEQGEPDPFLKLLFRACERSRWCSFDPVCREHSGLGSGQLNRAACHACALLPETSCDHGNKLLDRLFLCGDESARMPGFLSVITGTEG